MQSTSTAYTWNLKNKSTVENKLETSTDSVKGCKHMGSNIARKRVNITILGPAAIHLRVLQVAAAELLYRTLG